MKSLAIAAAVAAFLAPAAVAVAQAQSDPAAQTIDAFDASLLDTMKQARSLGVQGRYAKLGPVVERAFDLPTMTRFAVGPKWAELTPQDKGALIRSFSRLSVANYAKNFDSYGGERITIDPKIDTRGPDKLVRTHILSQGSKPVDLTYRMRTAADGKWKIIDVYYNGSISELTTRRSDFAGTMNDGGASALVKKIDALADKLVKTT